MSKKTIMKSVTTGLVVCSFVLGSALFSHASLVLAAPKAKEISFWNDSEESSQFDVDHSKWSEFLQKYIDAEHPSGVARFDYAAVTAEDKEGLQQYLEYVQQYDPRQLSKASQKAYWLNLFNAGLISQVLTSEPEGSIKDISSRVLWRKKRFYIAMQKMSLDDVEHGVLRPIFKDPRVHFCLSGGTIGSANIMPKAFTADNVEDMLEIGVRSFLNHPRAVSFDGDELVLSSIFKWYRTDFGSNMDEVKQFISQYLNQESVQLVNQASRVRYQYDWSLNQPEG